MIYALASLSAKACLLFIPFRAFRISCPLPISFRFFFPLLVASP